MSSHFTAGSFAARSAAVERCASVGGARWPFATGALFAGALAAALAAALASAPAGASSHREAPFIAGQPRVDGTDFYMFRSYEPGREHYVTLVANYLPLQDPYGGPNYFALDADAHYEIHVDNNGDANEDLTFRFRVDNRLRDNRLTVGGKSVSIPLVTNGSGDVDGPNSPALNVRETYTVEVVRNGRHRQGQRVTHAGTGAAVFDKPVDYIGDKSISDYPAYAAKHVHEVRIPGCGPTGRVFVGQRKDPFVVNLGETFDLVNYRAPVVELDPDAERSARDSLADKNVTAIVLEVPIQCLVRNDPVIGGWTTASLPALRGLASDVESGIGVPGIQLARQVQVSRLGMPLVNEVVIGLKDKNRFNASHPRDDGQFADYVTHPTLPALVEALFASAGVRAPTAFPRNDLVTAFLTGVPGINKPINVVPAEMLRLNTSTPPVPRGQQKNLGVIGGDLAGFPNGRRPGDDVVDVALRVVMGRLCLLDIGCAAADAPSGALNFTDGAFVDDSHFDERFPYLRTPLRGSPQVFGQPSTPAASR